MTRKPSAREARLSKAALRTLAQLVVSELRPQLMDPDPHFTREEAATFLRVSTREFDRERDRCPELLKPARERRPLLWRRSTLEVYRASSL